MSRTTRRKGFNYNGNRNSFDHESEKDAKRNARWAEFWEEKTGRKVVHSEAYLKWWDTDRLEVRFHADKPKRSRSIPSWFIRVYYYAPERAAMRDAIRHALRVEDYEDIDVVSYVDFHTDMAWDWW